MSRFLLAWELGSNLGHLGGLVPLAQVLRGRGHEVTLVAKDLSGVANVTGLGEFCVLQAPVWLKFDNAPEPPQSYADILARFGYAHPAELGGMVKAWCGLFALVNPDLIVAEHAPTALLAARAAALPRVTYGTGFFLPPRVHPLPNMRPWLDVPPARLLACEDKVLASVNHVLSTLRADPLTVLADLLATDADFLMTFRELDHYRNRHDGDYLGVISSEGAGREPAWPAGAGKKIFAYLHGDYRDMEKILSVLCGTDSRTIVFAPGLVPAVLEKFRSPRLAFVSEPLALSAVARQCDLAICHGGTATAVAFLRAGCPLLLLPKHLEQYLVSMQVEGMGAGLLINPDVPDTDIAGVLRRLLKESSFKARALDFADRYADFDPARVLRDVVTRCENIITESRHAKGAAGK